ncbi:MAG: CvpA family protein [Rikenellaceae bacterium]
MNIIDIIIVVAFALFIVLGLRSGLIKQLGSFAGLILAIILAKSLSAEVAALLHIGGEYATIWGYIIVFVAVLLSASAITYLLRKVVQLACLGPLDRLLGAVLGAIKCALILSLSFALFDFVNSSFEIVDKKVTESSQLYHPIISTSKYILPTLNWIEEKLPNSES